MECLLCVVCVSPFLLLFEVPLFIRYGRAGKVEWPHFFLNLLFACLLAVMLDFTGISSFRFIFSYGVITKQGLHIPADEINLIPFHALAADIRPYLGNILLFVPFGFFLPLLWERYRLPRRTALCGFLFSLAIELSQLFNRRISDVDDLLMNTLGALLGWLLWFLLRKSLSAVCRKVTLPKEKERRAFLLRHEAAFEMLAAFTAMFFNPFFF